MSFDATQVTLTDSEARFVAAALKGLAEMVIGGGIDDKAVMADCCLIVSRKIEGQLRGRV